MMIGVCINFNKKEVKQNPGLPALEIHIKEIRHVDNMFLVDFPSSIAD